MRNFINIETNKLIIRMYKPGDEDDIIDLVKNNRDHLKYVINDWEYLISNKEDAEKYIKKYTLGFYLKKIYAFGIWYKPASKLVGQITLFHLDWNNLEAEIGSFIAVDFQRMGIITKAKSEIINYGFEKLELNKIFAICHIENYATHRVNEKCGFIREEETDLLVKYSIWKNQLIKANDNK